jgi:hypothetical protein
VNVQGNTEVTLHVLTSGMERNKRSALAAFTPDKVPSIYYISCPERNGKEKDRYPSARNRTLALQSKALQSQTELLYEGDFKSLLVLE